MYEAIVPCRDVSCNGFHCGAHQFEKPEHLFGCALQNFKSSWIFENSQVEIL